MWRARAGKQLLRAWSHRILQGAVAASVLASAAWAAGGAHVVEDSEVLEPGQCQVDLWVTRFGPGAGYANATPTCTLTSLPRLEWGAQFQHFWFSDKETTDQILGPNLKVNLVPEDKGVGVGVYFNSGVNLRTGDLEVATLLVPVTIPFNDHVRLNLNAGWQYLRLASIPDAFFWGAQVEAKVGSEVTIMAETFGRALGAAGAQLGLRWRPNDGPIDFDFLVGGSLDKALSGEFFDSVNTLFVTIGVTLRW
jgi:opacity protein-like surface antigen